MRQDIEASVIGGLLLGGLTPSANDVLEMLEPESFAIPLYQKVFSVIRKHARTILGDNYPVRIATITLACL